MVDGACNQAWGGGAADCVLNDCVLINNTQYYYIGGGGGAYDSTLNNCTVFGNHAEYYGGGTHSCTVNNSIIYGNQCLIAIGGRNNEGGTLNYCLTSPTAGVGGITGDPLFVNSAAGDFHLQPGSPCINAGSDMYVTNSTDMDGNPRVAGGTVDIGAYEFQNPASVISYAWLQHYGLPTDGTADRLDTDHDGLNNWQEWQAQTDPTNALSVLKLLTLAFSTNSPGLTITWQSSRRCDLLCSARRRP